MVNISEGEERVEMKKKIVTFVGCQEVGKSSIISQIVYKVFPQTFHSELKDVCTYHRDDTLFEFRYTAPTEKNMSKHKMGESHLIIYVYAWDDPRSYRWIQKYLHLHPKGIPSLLVCNKIDLMGELGEIFLCNNHFGQERIYTSAKESKNISLLFDKIQSMETNDLAIQNKSCCVIL